jgi:hypothetical protein
MTTVDDAAGSPAPVADADYQRRLQNYQVAKKLTKNIARGLVSGYGYDAIYAAAVAYQTAKNVEPFREILKQLYGFDIRHLDNLPIFADALTYVQFEIAAHMQDPKALTRDASEGYELRGILLSVGDGLARQAIFNSALLDKIREGSGYRDLITDLGSLSSMYRTTPRAIGGAVTMDQVNRASQLASIIQQELLVTESDNSVLSGLIEDRRDIAYLLTLSHHKVHSAMGYLRDDEQDVDSLVPPLYVPATHRSSAKAGSESETAQPQPAAATTAQPAATAQPAVKSANPMDNPFDDIKD